jgi:hypothetical protein
MASSALKTSRDAAPALAGNRPPVHFRTRLFLPQRAKRTIAIWRRGGFELMFADIGLQIAVDGAARAMSRLPLPDTPAAVARMAGAVALRNRARWRNLALGW